VRIDAEQVLCRFQLSSLARHGLGSLYEWIVGAAHQQKLQGATVLTGFYGFRVDGEMIEPHTWALTRELPVIVEAVDDAARIEALLRVVEPAFRSGVITLERAHVVIYRSGTREPIDRQTRDILATTARSRAIEVTMMKVPEDGVLLRIFVGESDRDPAEHRPLYETIVRRAREAELCGATVMRGQIGFGRHSRVHSAKFLERSTDLPIVIEIVDTEEKIQAFLPTVDELVTEGLVTLEAVRIARYV
jgi:PII-like signaling protein